MDPSLVNPANSGAMMSVAHNFCFPSASNMTPIAVPPNVVNSATQPHLTPMPIGPMFSVNQTAMPTQFVQPLNVPQQQTLSLSLNQPQPPPPQAGNLPVPQSVTLSQVPSSLSLATQPLPMGQVVCSSDAAAQNLNFVSPTLITVSGPSGTQSQFLSNPFNQFPIMLSNQPSLFSTINAVPPPQSRPIETAPVSQPLVVDSARPASQTQQVGVARSNNTVSLSSQPVSVFSFPSPAMSVAPLIKPTEVSSQPSPDTTGVSLTVPDANPSCHQTQDSHAEASNIVSSSTPSAFVLVPPSPSPGAVDNKCSDVENGTLKGPHVAADAADLVEGKPEVALVVPCARMKFTPVDSKAPDPQGNKGSPTAADDDNSYDGNADGEDDNSNSGLPEVGNQASPQSPLIIKTEPFTNADGDYPDDESSKCSPSPFENVELAKNSGSLKDPSLHSKGDAQGELADVEDLEETEFVWEDYLRETGATAVPPTAFKHVEISLQSGFSKGMKLEAPNKLSPNTYWVATIVMTCGPLLRLRYEGYQDNSSADFWSDPMTSDVHPLGWCEENGKTVQPPDVIKEKFPNWQQYLSKCLKDATSAPSYLLDKSTGATPVDQIKEGMRLEVQEELRPDCLWLVKVVENVGGRLYLRHEGVEAGAHDFWMFYLDDRLHPIGWGEREGYTYAVPQAVQEASGKTEEELLNILKSTLSSVADQNLPDDIFNDQTPIEPHSFEVGMKLEVVDTKNGNICPATVVRVVDCKYFIVEIDSLCDLDPPAPARTQYRCHRNFSLIFPVNWAGSRGIKLAAPRGWEGADFKWDKYLRLTGAVAAPEELFNLEEPDHEFECGMKLEAVKPRQPGQICAATVTKLVEHLVWVHLDSGKRTMDGHVESVHSLNLFPIGWCVSNGFQLRPPGRVIGSAPARKRVAVVQPEMADKAQSESTPQLPSAPGRELYGGPQIYFNHRCFSGPYLSKGRIAELPRSVGPGPVTLVMTEVLSLLINTAYKSCRVLRELQLEGRPDPTMTQQMLKAKYKGKSYRAVVEICRTAGQLEDFCRHVCIKLECCPNLVSPHYISEVCPENCSQLTKTKYTYYYGKRKKKIGRPPGGHSNLENGQKKPGKRKKRKKIGMIAKRTTRPLMDEPKDNADDDKASVCSDTRTADSTSTTGSKEASESMSKLSRANLKRRYTHHIPPPSEIQTRGAKLPKYSFEKRTHKKIMIVEGSQQTSLLKSHKDGSRSSSLSRDLGVTPAVESSFCPSRPAQPVALKSEAPLRLEKNPLEWSVSEVGEFLQTTDCADRELVHRLRMEEIDGQALLLLTLPNVQEYMGVKLGPAIKLCHLIERIKIAFYQTFAK
ncbi:scm-like with four MBT domains protein 1 [Aplysia californica]|uniref:Scm-like with four MBT domains protein 1 n=1 Tax=Aplysia californica TaxID=6500 RepID=A0ABM0K8Q7_APLCA|nr:scm-like with four MBT domains protein 1 [Aplysia californica]